ncbi:DUF3080 family protein [Pseudoalteromonas spongiae]|uniref:DUF3080 family protein n=1 Tax=Pseudoalteromonas spongiae TaxID=298657 RepID=UPI0012FDE0D4|nr:DUF3080 family protein [Pseudoalteromonas spongiae]
MDYHARLNTQLTLPELSPYQDSKKLVLPTFSNIDASTIGILQLNKLQHCQLGQLIAERNSQLGKVSGPSSEFVYNVRFIQMVPNCVATLNDAELTKQLNEVKNQKVDLLFTYWEKMLFLDKQLASLYLPVSYSLLDINQTQKQHTLNTLNYLASVKSASVNQEFNQINSAELEAHLATLFKNSYLPSLLRAMYEQIFILQQQNKALESVSFNDICKTGHNNQSATVLTNIFSKFYGGKIQGYHNDLLQEYMQVKPALLGLWQNQYQQPYESDLKIHPLSLDNRLKHYSVAHVTWWQQLYKRCNIQPG